MMSRGNAEIVEGMLEAFNRGDVDGVIAAFDETCQIEEPPEMPDSPAGGYRGHDGIRRWMANLRDVAGVRFEQRSAVTSGEAVLAEWEGTGLGQASGVPIEWTAFVVAHVRDGRIVTARAFLTEAEARSDFGGFQSDSD